MNKTKNSYRILYFTLEYGKTIAGGAGRVINGIAANLGNRAAFSIFYLKFNLFRKDWDVYLYHKCDENLELKKFSRNYKTVLKNLLKTEKYDLAHFLYTGEHCLDCLNIIKEYGPDIKTIYSCHSIAKYEVNIRKTAFHHVIFEEDIVNQIDHIHFLNKTSLNYFKIAYPRLADRISFSIIPNGIDEDEYLATDPAWLKKLSKKTGTDNIIISCLTRWSYGKGLEYLLAAVPEVIRYKKNIRFIIAGKKLISWENGYLQFQSLINKKLALMKEYVIPLGWLDNICRNSVYSISDIYVMPSLLEYYPYSILEPMAKRIPIISSRIDAVTELLKEEEDCLLYEPTNSDELAEKIIYLIRRPELRDRFKNNAYRKVKSINNWETILEDYIKMYESVLENHLHTNHFENRQMDIVNSKEGI